MDALDVDLIIYDILHFLSDNKRYQLRLLNSQWNYIVQSFYPFEFLWLKNQKIIEKLGTIDNEINLIDVNQRKNTFCRHSGVLINFGHNKNQSFLIFSTTRSDKRFMIPLNIPVSLFSQVHDVVIRVSWFPRQFTTDYTTRRLMYIKITDKHCLFLDYSDFDNIVIYPLKTPNSGEFPKNNFYQLFSIIFIAQSENFLPFHDLPFVDLGKMMITIPETCQDVYHDAYLNKDGSLIISAAKEVHYFVGSLKMNTFPSMPNFCKYVCNHYIVDKETTKFTIYNLLTCEKILDVDRVDDFSCDVLTLTNSHFWLRTLAQNKCFYYLVDIHNRKVYTFNERRMSAMLSKVEQKSDSFVIVHYYDDSVFRFFEIDFNLIPWDKSSIDFDQK